MSYSLFNYNSGFYKTPVTKGILNGVLITSCAFHVPIFSNYKHFIVYNVSDVLYRHKLWKLILPKLAFLDIKDLICGCLLIYYFRVFERRFGSHKFSSFLLSTFIMSTLIEVGIVCLLNHYNILHIDSLASGPFSIIFPLFINFFLDIPSLNERRILGISFTGKSLVYLLGLQTMITSSGTMICCFAGLLSGILCRYNFLKICDFIKVPKIVSKISSKLFGWLLDSKPPSDNSFNLGATLEIQRQQHFEIMEQQMLFQRISEANQSRSGLFRRRNDLNHHQRVENESNQNNLINEEQVQTLVEMGFNRQNVVRALERSNNDANLATTILLNES